MGGGKMNKKRKGSIWFWISAVVIWLIVSAFFVNRVIDPFIESIFKPKKATGFWIELLETVITTFLGMMATYFIQDLIKNNLKEAHRELLEEMGKESWDNAYFAYHLLIRHAGEMKDLVNRLVNLPRHPEIMKVLIEDYSKKAKDSKFLVDFPTFLNLAKILVDESKEMYFVNTTPPYEWWYPIQFEKRDEIKEAISSYKKKVEERVQRDSKVSRISIVKSERALISVLEDGFYIYFENLGIRDLGGSEIDNDTAKPIIAWAQQIIRGEGITNSILNILNNTSDDEITKYKKMMESFWNSSSKNFKDDFQQASKTISKSILDKFINSLHKPTSEGYYILKDKVSITKKDDLQKFAKEEGIFIDNANNRYLLRIEEANGVNVLLITIKIIDSKEETHFKKLMDDFINNDAEKRGKAVGKLVDLLEKLKKGVS
jgi:hypothetical protein